MKHDKIFVWAGIALLVFSLLPPHSLYAGENENIKKWISQLSDRRQRPGAKSKLIQADERATGQLIIALKDEHAKSSVKVDIIEICGKNKIKEAIPILKKMANSPKVRLRLASMRALGAMADMDKELPRIFKEATKDPNEGAKLAAISALMKLKDRSAIANFIESLSDQYTNVRLKALEALSLFNDKSAMPALIERLNDTNDAVVLKTVDMLSNFKDKQIVEALLKRLNTANKNIKVRVIEALARIRDKSALPRLRSLLSHEYIKVRHAAKNAIDIIEG